MDTDKQLSEERLEELRDIIRQVVSDMYSEIACIANETAVAANASGNVAGFDTKVWGKKPNKKRGLYSLDREDDED